MNRLQKKCFIASASIHGLLAVIILVGPGFMSATKPVGDLPVINFVDIPAILVEQNVVGGGSPKAKPPTPTAPAPQVQQAVPPPEPKPQPKVRDPEPVEPAKTQTESFEERAPKKHTPEISTTLKTRPKNNTKTTSKASDESRDQDREANEQRRHLSGLFADAAKTVKQGTSSATTIEEVGNGSGGGPAYASYLAWIQAVYENGWVPPDDISVDSGVAYASVTIAHDGTIVSATLTSRSGNGQIDASVQRTLDRVTTIGRPLPETIKDAQRTYKLKFDLKAKRGMA
jgi:hypothetical protein